jgi:hypothetical protein
MVGRFVYGSVCTEIVSPLIRLSRIPPIDRRLSCDLLVTVIAADDSGSRLARRLEESIPALTIWTPLRKVAVPRQKKSDLSNCSNQISDRIDRIA